jgi:F-type H+-transporting ATPase subunit delta
MKFPKSSITTGRQLFRASFTDGILDAGKVKGFAARLIEEKPRHYIPTLRYLQKLVRLEEASRHVTVESASALDPRQQRDILAQLSEKYGQGLTSEFKVNPDLIGGVSIRVGSDVYDGSVRGRLARLKLTFAK